MGKDKIAIFPIFLPFLGCPFKCIYCNQLLVSKANSFDTLKKVVPQVKKFLQHNIDKQKEIAFYGGTFTNLSKREMSQVFETFSDFVPKDVCFRISTRPDCIDKAKIKFLKSHNVDTIELGVQSFSDRVLEASKRGYSSSTAIKACKLVISCGLKLTIQLMPFLPSFSADSLTKTIKTTKSISPDFVRIYPCLVLKDTKIEKLYFSGSYTAPSLKETIEVVGKMKHEFENAGIKVIKVGLHSDISEKPENVVAGGYHPRFGEMVKTFLLKKKILSCRGFSDTLFVSHKDLHLFRLDGHHLTKELNKQIGEFRIKGDKRLKSGNFYFKKVVGDTGFEPVTSTMST